MTLLSLQGRSHGRAHAERIVAALDVGSSKIACLVARLSPGEEPEVLGAGNKLCSGLKHGTVSDLAATEDAIRSVIDQAEASADVEINAAFLNASPLSLRSDIISCEVPVPGSHVQLADMTALKDAAFDAVQALDGVAEHDVAVLHALPAHYLIDGQLGVSNPEQFCARSLGMDAVALTADAASIANLDNCARRAHVQTAGFVAAPLASGLAALYPEERENGVALIELGAGVTTVSVFAQDMLVSTRCLRMGSFELVDELCMLLKTRREHAERLFATHGAVTVLNGQQADMLSVPGMSTDPHAPLRPVSAAYLAEIIRRRALQMLEQLDSVLDAMGFWRSGGRQIVLTGGLARLNGLDDLAQLVFQGDRRSTAARKAGVAVRLAEVAGLNALPQALSGPAFSTVAGMIQFIDRAPEDIWHSIASRPRRVASGRFGRMISILRNSF